MHPKKCSLKTSTLTSRTYCQKLTLSFLLFTLIFYLFSFTEGSATIRYVSKTGLSIPPYTTWETAADSIQECINICVFGDTIYVANGVYEEQVVMIPGLSLIGAGADSTIINTQSLVNSNGFVAVEVKDSCLFKGFQIVVYYNSEKGYGIAQSGNSVVKENKITTAAYGMYVGYTGTNVPLVYNNNICKVSKGIDSFNSYVIVRSNTIYTDPNSSAVIIAGIKIGAHYNYYQPIVDSNYIVTPKGRGIEKSFGARPTIKNNIIVLKFAPTGIFLSTSDSTKIFNNLIIDDSTAATEGITNYGVQYLQVKNNYIMGNFLYYGMLLDADDEVKNNVVTNAKKGVEADGTQNLVFQYNNVWNNEVNYTGFTPDSTNFSVDPMIVNDNKTQGDLDFHLQMYSPLIDAGDPNILDKDGSRSDIGLYGGPYGESYINVDLPPRPPVNLTANVDTLIKLNWNKNTEADFSYYKVYRDTTFDFSVDSTKLIASVTDTFYYHTFPSNVETLYYKLTAVDNQGNESNPSEQVFVKILSVKNEWVPVNNYILYQNYPNPFNPSTKIGYKLKERGYVKLYVYDVKGELVSVLVNEVQESGYYEVEFSTGVGSGQSAVGKSLASGVYIYQIFVSNENRIPVFSDIKKMLLIK